MKEGLFYLFYFFKLLNYFYFGVVDIVGFASITAHISFKAVKESLFYFILFLFLFLFLLYFIKFYFILFYFILFYFILILCLFFCLVDCS